MESIWPLLFAAVVGFTHAFEVDHLLAVSNIVTKRNNLILAIKDGIYWGLGHTSTVFLIGLIIIVGKATFLNGVFSYFEALVGLMLVSLGIFRLFKYFSKKPHEHHSFDHNHHHRLAYGIGLVHGLAGSGAMILLVMSEIQNTINSLLYLIIFGMGSIAGMLLAAGLFNFPFSKKVTQNAVLQTILILSTSIFCVGYGGYLFFESLS